MCLCHRQQCPFISGAAPVYSGTRHKGRFVQLRDVSSWLCLIRAANPSYQPRPVSLGAGYATSQSGLWWPRGFAGPSPPELTLVLPVLRPHSLQPPTVSSLPPSWVLLT